MNSRGDEVCVPLNTCNKIFVQRDYSKGLGVQFETAFPSALEGKISEQAWAYTITTLNSYYSKAEEVCCATVLETLTGCLSCYISRLFVKTQYEKSLLEINRFLAEQNTNVYLPSGVHLTDPIQRGLRVFEISLIQTSPVLHQDDISAEPNYALGLDQTD
uniref:Ras modification protein ERF4 n=1 Tax=Setaria digitata TaxID=48799 RepID=A0A915PGP6_9BILA